MRLALCLVPLLVALVLTAGPLPGQEAAKTTDGLTVSGVQKDYLAQEPILITVRLADKHIPALPAAVGAAKEKVTLSFEIQPAVKPRKGGKPLPVEGQVAESTERVYDLLEWYQFPAQGKFTVRAVARSGEATVSSEPFTVVLRRPEAKTPEWGPVDRLHHIPWGNYVTDAFCGDTFDLVKRWPDSRLAKYGHYWNGVHMQNKKEYAKAVESFRAVAAKHPDFILAADAELGVVECLLALGKATEAANQALSERVTKGRRSVALHHNALRSRQGAAEALNRKE
jgi:hypothetical protein